MILLDYFKRYKTCHHDKVLPNSEFAYCPDCGELVENQWYLVRCSCCGIKLKGMLKNGEMIPEKKFCHNCGTNHFIVEKLNKINFIDIRYSILVKTVVKSEINSFTQSWIDPRMGQYGRRLIGMQPI